MAKQSSKSNGIGTTGVVAIVVGVALLSFGAWWWLKRKKKKEECEKAGGTWDSKTGTCILPQKEDKTKKVLKDAYDNLTFESGKAIIKSSSYPFLDEIAVIMADSDATTWKLDIKGHTDNLGTDEYNQTLSQNRANAVKEYLIKKGIPAERINAQGFGESKPITTNDTPEGRAKNRRVEFFVLKPTGEVVTNEQKPEENKPASTTTETKPEDKKPSETTVITQEKKVNLVG